MYYAIVALLMFVLPVLSIAVDARSTGVALGVGLVAKWFVFWSVGWRLFLAGLRQIVQPAYTAREILGITGDAPLLLVRELGYANVAIGAIGIASLFIPGWTFAAALAGAVFYGLAGLSHILQKHRNRLENVAMASDLFVGFVLATCCVLAFAERT